jgi:phage-related protein
MAAAISEADGAFGTIIGVFATVLSIGALLVGIIGSAIAGFLALGGSLSTLVTIGATVLGAIGLIITAIASLPATLIAAIAGVIAFAIALVTNFMGARDKLTSIVGTIVNFVVDGFKWLVENGLSFLSDLVNRGVGFFNTLADNLATWAEDVANDAVDWGKGIIDGLVSGLKNAITSGGSKIKELLGLDDISTSGVSSNAFNFDSISTGNLDTSVSGGNDFIGSVGSGDNKIFLDGREIENNQGRYRKDALNRRG